MMSAPFLATLLHILLLCKICHSQIGADGFENAPCLRLGNFSIDGDWWAKSDTEIDWSSVLEGTRTTATNSEWRSTQNQCTKNPAKRWGYFYKAGIFCDTFDINEASHLQTGTKHALDAYPDQWTPLISTSMQDKGDLTNAYYVGSDMDLIICAAFERIDVNGVSYMDIEFNQNVVWNVTDPVNCNTTKGEGWKCLYPDRVDSDIQVSFQIANDITQNVVVISQWDTASTSYIPVRTEDMSTATDPYYYKSPDGAFEAAVSSAPMNASSFGYICDDKNPLTADCPQIPYGGAFFESCIDFKKVGITELHFESLVIKARASPNGAYKDTSGVLWHVIEGPQINDWAVNYCGVDLPTQSPTTSAPTDATPVPTPRPTDVGQTDNPTTSGGGGSGTALPTVTGGSTPMPTTSMPTTSNGGSGSSGGGTSSPTVTGATGMPSVSGGGSGGTSMPSTSSGTDAPSTSVMNTDSPTSRDSNNMDGSEMLSSFIGCIMTIWMLVVVLN